MFKNFVYFNNNLKSTWKAHFSLTQSSSQSILLYFYGKGHGEEENQR